MTAEVGGMGHAPSVSIKPLVRVNPEKVRYQQMWNVPEYRRISPGEQQAMKFLKQANVEQDAEVLDLGCGTGRGALMLALLGGMRVTMIDFAGNCLDKEVAEACVTQPERIKFMEWDLTETLPVSSAYGYCCDVMEHIPTDLVDKVLRNILGSAQHVFFNISTAPDSFGPKVLGEPLHLTVKPMMWWLDKLAEFGAVVHWSSEAEVECSIYCSAWRDASKVVVTGKINTDVSVVCEQIRTNILAGWNHITPFDKQNREVIVLAGGPSMAEQTKKITELVGEKCGLVTVNGAYNWAMHHGYRPSMQVVLDAREFNSRFAKPVTDYTKYLIASQVHPSTLAELPRDRTWLWHSGLTKENEALVKEKTGHYFPIPGGSTVVLRVIPLLRMMGFWRIHLFGFDSCVLPRWCLKRPDGTLTRFGHGGEHQGSVLRYATKEQCLEMIEYSKDFDLTELTPFLTTAHHSYDQAENDKESVIPVVCGGKTFECTPWMLSQATEFRDLVGFLGNEVELAVYGDGLIAQMLETGASFNTQEH